MLRGHGIKFANENFCVIKWKLIRNYGNSQNDFFPFSHPNWMYLIMSVTLCERWTYYCEQYTFEIFCINY